MRVLNYTQLRTDSIVSAFMLQILRLIILVVSIAIQIASAASEGLSVFTSDDPQSNALHSFVVVPARYEIPQGINKQPEISVLKKQSPFRIELLDSVADDEFVQWSITIAKNSFGGIRVRSNFSGKKVVGKISTIWTSFRLDKPIKDRQILIFEPRQQKHLPRIYKKGKPVSANVVSDGGGTKFIDIEGRNPRLTYEIEGRILNPAGKLIKSYSTTLQMDDKDLIRQEYINHYKISRSTAGEAGNLSTPIRDEIKLLPSGLSGYDGNTLSDSEYELFIENGVIDLSRQILDAYKSMKEFHRIPGNELKDLNGQSLMIPDSRLWLSSGWRNPERNEWFSDALNGTHQLGTAFDLMPNEIPRKKEAAIVYWVLWRAVESLQDRQRIFAKLKGFNMPLRPLSFKLDIEPKNGIPDAFDKADHLHINLVK